MRNSHFISIYFFNFSASSNQNSNSTTSFSPCFLLPIPTQSASNSLNPSIFEGLVTLCAPDAVCFSRHIPHASVSFYPMLFSTHEFPMEVHLDHGKMSFSFRYNHPGVPALFQFLSHSILLPYHLHSPL